MTVELGLLLLESLLLVATVILLVYNIHEGKQRDNLLREVGKATKVLTRQEYFFSVMESMLDAEREIIGCITGRPPSGDDIKMTRNIVGAIEKMTEKGVRIKYLLPKFPGPAAARHSVYEGGSGGPLQQLSHGPQHPVQHRR